MKLLKLEKLKLVIVLALTWLFCVAQSPSPGAEPRREIPASGNQVAAPNEENSGPSALVIDKGNSSKQVQKESREKNQPTHAISDKTSDTNVVLAIVGVLQVLLWLNTWVSTQDNADTLIRIHSAYVRITYMRIK
jgi:hypothetical protein